VILKMSEVLKDALVEAITEEGWDDVIRQDTLSLVYSVENGTVIDLVDGIGHLSDFNDMRIPTELTTDEAEDVDDDILNLVDLIRSRQATVLPHGEIITVYSTIDFFGLGNLAAANSEL